MYNVLLQQHKQKKQSAQSSLASYQLSSDPNLYASTNGNHSRSPQFYNNSMSSHMQASNMQSYSYNSPPNTVPTSYNHHGGSPNNINHHSSQHTMNTTSSPPRPHRADFSPLPYTQQQYRQQQFAPPQLNLHDPNTMYSTHHQQTQPNYQQDPSWTAHQQQKRMMMMI